MVEEYRSHVVQVAVQSEKASPGLVAPDLDFVVVATGHEEGLSRMKVNAADWAIVLFKAIDKGSHAIIP